MPESEDMPQVLAQVMAGVGGLWGSLTAVGEWLWRADAWEPLLGSGADVPLLASLHPDDVGHWHTAVALTHTASPQQLPHTFLARLRLANQAYNFYEWHLAPLPDNQIALQAWNIHHRHPTLSSASEEHALLAAILQTSIGAVVVLDDTGQILFANDRAEEVLGLTYSDLTYRTYDDPGWRTTDLDGGPWPDEKQPFRIVMTTGQPVFNIRHAIVWPNGQRKALAINGAPLREPSGKISKVVFLIHDITQQLATERTLYESEALFRGMVESQVDLVCRYTPEGVVLYANEAYARYFAVPRDQLIGHSFLPLVAEEERPKVLARLIQLQYDPAPMTVINRERNYDGHPRWVQWTDYGLLNEKGELYMVQAVGRDVTELKLLELALRESQHRLEMLIDNLPGVVYRCRYAQGWPMMYISDQAELLLGYRPIAFLTGQISFNELILPEWRGKVETQIAQAVRLGEPFELVYQIRHKDGEVRWLWERGRSFSSPDAPPEVIYLEGFITDVTEQKQAEAAVLQAQKVESLGVLAGGIAHDFNNLLVAIMGQSGLALRKMEPESLGRKPVEKVVQAAKRAAELTRQLLAYSGQGQLQVSPLSLNEVIEENSGLLQVAMSHRVAFSLALTEGLPLILADAGQIQQIVMNLVLNAAEAIGEGAGQVWLSTAVRHIPPDEELQSQWMKTPLASGDYVQLHVRDDGCGMSQETLNRIFDPFFSTKFTGRGLGLSAVAGIVQSHHGGLDVVSQVGHGTLFTLLFPVYIPPMGAMGGGGGGQDTAVFTPTTDQLNQLHGTILLIDDEPLIREAVRDMLDEPNLTLLEASNGIEGIDTFAQHRPDIRLILLDIAMPHLSGYDTLKLLRQIDPHIPIILSSGYAANLPQPNQTITTLATDFIHKPYQPQQLYQLLLKHLST